MKKCPLEEHTHTHVHAQLTSKLTWEEVTNRSKEKVKIKIIYYLERTELYIM